WNWNTKPMRLLRNSASRLGLIVVSSSPSNLIEPDVGRSSEPRIWRNADLPTPDAPTHATMSPGASDRSTSHNTGSAWPLWMYALPSFLTSIRAPRWRNGRTAAAAVGVEGSVTSRISKGRRNLLSEFLTVNAWDQRAGPRVA